MDDVVQAVQLVDIKFTHPEFDDDHWQAPIALHRTHLHEHHTSTWHPCIHPAL